MPDNEVKKPIPKELLDIALPITPAQIARDAKTPQQVIAANKLEDIFGTQGTQGSASIFQHASMHRPENAKLMLAKEGATADHVYMKDNNRNTALHYAAHRGNEELARNIIDFNGATSAHLQIANIKGDTPLKIMQHKGREDLAQYLQEKINKLKAVEIASQPSGQTCEPAKTGKPKSRSA